MKKAIPVILSLVLGGAIVSCRTEQQPKEEGGIRFSLTASSSKAVLESEDGTTFDTVWQKGDRVAAFFDNSVQAELVNVLEDGPLAEFQGTAQAPEQGLVRTFYPASAYVAHRSCSDVDVSIPTSQNPLESSVDSEADLMACRPAEYVAEGGVASACLLSFDRLSSVLQIRLSGEASGMKILKARLYVPDNYMLTGTANLNLDNNAIEGLVSGSNYVEALYEGEGLDAGKNSLLLSVYPVSIAEGSKVHFLAYTSEICIDKTITLTSAMAFPAGGIAQLNLTVGSTDCRKITEALDVVDGMQLYSANATKKSYIDMQTGKTYSKNELEVMTKAEKQSVDFGPRVQDAAYRFENISGKTYGTRFCHLEDMTGEEYMSIVSRSAMMDRLDNIDWDDAHAPMTSPYFTAVPTYFAIKTYTKEENNQYGLLEVTSCDGSSVTFNYKFGHGGSSPEYSGARTVTISDGSMYVDGVKFYVNGAAATMKHTLMASYGANVCRIYSSGTGTTTSSLLDRMHEKGLMCIVGLPARSYKDFASGERTYEDESYRKEKIDTVMQIVGALKDHPAVLCWCLGNELDGSGNSTKEGFYKYYGELEAKIRTADTKHPVTAAFTEAVAQSEINLVNKWCPNLDFLCFNSYYSYLKKYEKGAATDYTQLLAKYGWTKPFMITEYGPTGTWNRTSEYLNDRINSWGALIQLSSDEAAQQYIDCYNLIRDYDNCLGSVAFWWGYQSHGEVLGWYPFFTKEYFLLPAVEALQSCWTDTEYNPTAPKIMSWASSIELNGRNVASAEWSSTKQAEKNPVLSPGQKCTAKVYAHCRSGHPNSTLRYKWFIYQDCTYYHKTGDTDWTRVTWDECESAYTPYGGHKSMDEDARADLFTDRTLPEVEFTAPEDAANYRLYCIVYDDSNGMAGTVCLNFRVEAE